MSEGETVLTANSGHEALETVGPDVDIVDVHFDAPVVKPVDCNGVTTVVAEMCERARNESTLAGSGEHAHDERRLAERR
ncbi:MAG: hypothetical protein V5A44_02670 [Haloarculaceae archaeon]